MALKQSFFKPANYLIEFNILMSCFFSATLKYSNDAIRRLIGPLGILKRKIEEETGLFFYDILLPCQYSLYGFHLHRRSFWSSRYNFSN